MAETTAIAQLARNDDVGRCVRALAGATRTLQELVLSMPAHPDSSVAHCAREGEDALLAMGVTWCRLRGWVVAVKPAGAEPLRQERIDPFMVARRAHRIARVLEGNETVPVERVIGLLRDVEALLGNEASHGLLAGVSHDGFPEVRNA